MVKMEDLRLFLQSFSSRRLSRSVNMQLRDSHSLSVDCFSEESLTAAVRDGHLHRGRQGGGAWGPGWPRSWLHREKDGDTPGWSCCRWWLCHTQRKTSIDAKIDSVKRNFLWPRICLVDVAWRRQPGRHLSLSAEL